MAVKEEGLVDLALDLSEDDRRVSLVFDYFAAQILYLQIQHPVSDVACCPLQLAVSVPLRIVRSRKIVDFYVLDQRWYSLRLVLRLNERLQIL